MCKEGREETLGLSLRTGQAPHLQWGWFAVIFLSVRELSLTDDPYTFLYRVGQQVTKELSETTAAFRSTSTLASSKKDVIRPSDGFLKANRLCRCRKEVFSNMFILSGVFKK